MSVSRRSFLLNSLGGIATAAALGTVLDACASSPASTSAVGTSSGAASVSLQLRWIDDAQFAGSFVAKSDGYYAADHVNLTIKPGGAGISAEPLVAQGKVDVGISSAESTARAVSQGAALKIIGAGYQSAASTFISLPASPVRSLAGMKGKKIGAISANIPLVQAVLTANHVPKDAVTIVPTQGDISSLTSGQVDVMMGIVTSEPLLLEAQGIKPVLLDFASLGFDELDFTYCVSQKTLDNPARRAAITDFMRAEIRGWQKALADPQYAAKLSVDVYGKGNGLVMSQQLAQAQAQKSLFDTPETSKAGLFSMSGDMIDKTIATLAKQGIKSDASLFDTSVLTEARSA